ncbi:MAG: alpha/beta fold hydrolase [Chthoniobacter sp.]|uniref:esterase/lipase family protein n=1 Tax=Chthoniobacter sp. TaxID=2510640 RepID=UPI0032A73EE0
MTFSSRWSFIFVAAALSLAGCSEYATISETRPHFTPVRSTVGTLMTINQEILGALKDGGKDPQTEIGRYLTCAETAAQELQRHPNDEAARQAYNFAVARVFSTIKSANLDPWSKPLRVPSAGGDFILTHQPDPRPQYNPALYDFTPADQFDVKGTYVTERTVKEGIGAPMVAVGKELRKDAKETFTIDRVYYGITGLVRFEKGRRCVISFADPLNAETVQFEGRTYPLAADFTVPLAVMLARENPKKLELARALRPGSYANTARVARLQPYDPNKTVVLVVHGLVDSPATWAPMLNYLRGDAFIRQHYQFWFFSYPSGYPYPYSAALLRQDLDAVEAKYPLRHKMVVIGHSMGSLISRLMITDSGDQLWLKTFGKPPARTDLSPETKKLFEESLIFRHRGEIGRVIFIAGPHRGADMATGWFGRLASSLIHAPTTILKAGPEALKLMSADTSSLQLKRMPNSVDTLAPNSRFVKNINAIPITPGIPYHSIIGDRGKGGNKDKTPPVSSDGIVPYWSSHLDGAQSELVVPSSHSAHQNHQAMVEVQRILRLHGGAAKN